MRKWVTQIQAIHPHTGELSTWLGEHVEAPTMQLAQSWCDQNKGYLKVVGELVCEIPIKKGKPDFENKIDYDLPQQN